LIRIVDGDDCAAAAADDDDDDQNGIAVQRA
jgi:hypothetical protein